MITSVHAVGMILSWFAPEMKGNRFPITRGKTAVISRAVARAACQSPELSHKSTEFSD